MLVRRHHPGPRRRTVVKLRSLLEPVAERIGFIGLRAFERPKHHPLPTQVSSMNFILTMHYAREFYLVDVFIQVCAEKTCVNVCIIIHI